MERKDFIDVLVGNDYRICHAIAEEMYHNEDAIQSCCATLIIQLSNMRRNNPQIDATINKLETERNQFAKARELYETLTAELEAKAEEEASKPRDDMKAVIALYWQPIAEAYPKARDYLETLMKRMDSEPITFFQAKEMMDDYIARNGFVPTLIGALSPRAESEVDTDVPTERGTESERCEERGFHSGPFPTRRREDELYAIEDEADDG